MLPSTGTQADWPDNTIKRLNVVELFWRRKLIVLSLLLLGGFAGFVSVLYQVPNYRAAAVVEILNVNESFMGMNQVDPQAAAGNYAATASNIQTQIRILLSGSTISRVVERLGLELTPVASTPTDPFGRVREKLGLLPREPVEQMNLAIRTAAGTATARSLGSSRLLEISASSTSPTTAASFVNALANEYIAVNSQFRSKSAQVTAQWIEGQVEETKFRLEQAEKRLQDFVRKSGSQFAGGVQETLADVKMRQLQQDLALRQADRIVKQSRLEQARTGSESVLEDSALSGLQGRAEELKRERAGLTTTLTEQHWRVQRLDRELAQLEASINQRKTAAVTKLQSDYESAAKAEQMLSGAHAAASGSVAGQAGPAAEMMRLKSEVETTRHVYGLLLQQLYQASVVTALPTNSVRVIDAATPQYSPTKPHPLKDILSGFGAGAALAALVLIPLEKRRLNQLNRTVSTPAIASTLLELPQLGVVPNLSDEPESHSWIQRLRSSQPALLTSGDGPDLNESREFASESFHMILASILGAKTQGWRPVLVVASSASGEGKTMLTTNLARTTAETGRRVLLIDADLRKPNPATGGQAGLADLLREDGPLDSLSRYVHPTEVPGLFVLPAGTPGSHPGRLLFSPKMPPLIGRLRREYDVVLIDTPPALQFPDACLMTRLSDGVILVVRAGTPRQSALAARARLSMEGPILGMILNDWVPEDQEDLNLGNYTNYQGYGFVNRQRS